MKVVRGGGGGGAGSNCVGGGKPPLLLLSLLFSLANCKLLLNDFEFWRLWFNLISLGFGALFRNFLKSDSHLKKNVAKFASMKAL